MRFMHGECICDSLKTAAKINEANAESNSTNSQRGEGRGGALVLNTCTLILFRRKRAEFSEFFLLSW